MKSHPILFNSEMVNTILKGRKTQTRRAAKLPLPYCDEYPMSWHWSTNRRLFEPCGSIGHLAPEMKRGVRPNCAVGERLWVRETWQSAAAMNVCHEADDYYIYRSGDPDWETTEGWKWRPSIHMPREACRLELLITDVRIERLQDITEEDAKAEGANRSFGRYSRYAAPEFIGHSYRLGFRRLWESINGDGSWERNPWVWVYCFERLSA